MVHTYHPLSARDITLQLGGKWNNTSRQGVACCPAHHDRIPSLSIREANDGTLLMYCHAGCDFDEIIASLHTVDAINVDQNIDFLTTLKTAQQDNASAFAQHLWNQAQPIQGTPAEIYLRRRGIFTQIPNTLRFHPNCKHHIYGPSNALVAHISGAAQFAIHRTFITPEGLKQEWNPAKTMLGSVKGGAVHITSNPNATTLVVCEGIETALSLVPSFQDSNTNIWAALSASGLKTLILPPTQTLRHNNTTPTLIIAIDNDETGKNAAKHLAERATEAGYAVQILAPETKYNDFNDMIVAQHTINATAKNYEQFQKDETAVQTLTPSMMPEILYAFAHEIAESQHTPIDYAAVTALASMACIAGNTVTIYAKNDGTWCVHPNLWVALVGEPSSGKTIASEAALKPLKTIEYTIAQETRQTFGDADYQAFAIRVKSEAIKKQISDLIREGNENEARETFQKLKQLEARNPRLTINDATMESLGEVLRDNPRGLLMIRSELSGFIAELENPEKKLERSFYLQAYDGRTSFAFDRIGRGHVFIPKVTLSLLGTIQPTEIRSLVRSATRQKNNDGLIQRLQITVFPDQKPDYKWTEGVDLTQCCIPFQKLLSHLHEYAQPEAHVAFTPDAKEKLKEWVTHVKTELIHSHDSPVIKAHRHKMIDTILKLAFLFEAAMTLPKFSARPDNISLNALEMALKWEDYLMSHARRLYAL